MDSTQHFGSESNMDLELSSWQSRNICLEPIRRDGCGFGCTVRTRHSYRWENALAVICYHCDTASYKHERLASTVRLLSWKHYDKLQHMLGGVNGGVMHRQEKQDLIKKAESKLTMCLGEVHECADNCLVVTNSGGRARYMIGYLDNWEVFVEKLDPKTCPV